jgi:hypothetical protein
MNINSLNHIYDLYEATQYIRCKFVATSVLNIITEIVTLYFRYFTRLLGHTSVLSLSTEFCVDIQENNFI